MAEKTYITYTNKSRLRVHMKRINLFRMKQQKHSLGFTLVELAIVMTIIGLLIGGILKGQELLETARVTATIAQVKGYSAALSTFRDIYGATPGDMSNASRRIVGCTTNCDAAIVAGTDGTANDGKVGNLSTNYLNASMGLLMASQADPLAAPPVTVEAETQLFWVHLMQANLINGISPTSFKESAPLEWNVTNPAAKIGGGFIIGEAPPTGLFALIASSPTAEYMTNGRQFSGSGTGVMSPTRARQIDTKMDDGNPLQGDVVSTMSEECIFFDNATSQRIYNGAISSKACAIAFRLQ